jgi:hypothetical protein
MNGRRLSAFSAGNTGNWESGDRLRNSESPPLAGFSAIGSDQPETAGTAWLGREDSNLRMGESKSTNFSL